MKIALVACSKTKEVIALPAGEIYSSPLFRKSRELARRDFDQWFILSAKHGLLDPRTVISPYEQPMRTMVATDRAAWAEQVMGQVIERVPAIAEIHILGGRDYSLHLTALLERHGYKVILPLEGKSIGHRLAWLNGLLHTPGVADLDRFYTLLNRLASGGALAPFRELHGRSDLPKKGIYFFFEPGELRKSGGTRVVRVGTHGVSRGSNSTLWQRLKTHLGPADGRGNHRGSVFRLHVGAALLRTHNALDIPTWGAGANCGPEVRELERALEERVSAFMRGLQVSWLEIEDEAGPASDRAVLEHELISLLSRRFHPIDSPSGEWLGLQSPTPAIRNSGLWNIRSTDGTATHGALDMLEFFVASTLGQIEQPRGSVSGRFLVNSQPSLALALDGPDSRIGRNSI